MNIFGGIIKCDEIAEGIISACKMLSLQLPLVVRLQGLGKRVEWVCRCLLNLPFSSLSLPLAGTNFEQAKKMIADSGLKIHLCESFSDSAELVREMPEAAAIDHTFSSQYTICAVTGLV